jgi:glucose-1-phosphate thymidylyltransferase
MASAPPALVLARGLGRRMREVDSEAPLDGPQLRAAASGQKALMPVDAMGRPFLDYVLSSLADAGCVEVILVVAPDAEAIRDRYVSERLGRIRVRSVVQDEPTGTAHAVLAAEPMVGARGFLVANADNLYPVKVLQSLVACDGPALPGFRRSQLVQESGFPAARVAQFAVLQVDDEGWLVGIHEKPDLERLEAAGPDAAISMNLWRFDARIFDACRDVARSPRGEYELPEAVALAIARGVRLRVLPAKGAVLDLSRRADVAGVASRLAGLEPRL